MDNRIIIPFLLDCLITIIVFLLALVGVVCGNLIYLQDQTQTFRADEMIDSGYCGVESELSAKEEFGRTLFSNNCATCHNKDMKSNLTGPALGGATDRWKEYPEEDLRRWVRQSQTMIKQKHPRALKLWRAWQPTVMNDFPNLTDEEIGAIFSYISFVQTER